MIPGKDVGYRAFGWWRGLQPDPAANRPGDRGALARLRRCGAVAEAMREVATLELFRAVQATAPADLPGVALAAAVLAHMRTDATGTVARRIGPESLDRPETALVKSVRFRRLMEADGPEERLVAFRRLVAIAGGVLPIRDLAGALLDWGEERQRRWVFDYWNTQPPGAPFASIPAAPKDVTP